MKQNPEGEILTTISGEIGWLTIANPLNRNAMNLTMYQQIPAAIAKIVNAGIRVLIVQGHGEEASARDPIFLNLRNYELKKTQVPMTKRRLTHTKRSKIRPFLQLP